MANLTNPMAGTISSTAGKGVYPGAGVAVGGQQGRPKALTGGTASVKSPIANAAGSQPKSVGGVGPAPPKGTPAPIAPGRPIDAQRPTSLAPVGKRWAPTYGHWRQNAVSGWQQYIAGWHLAAAAAVPAPETHVDPGGAGVSPGSTVAAPVAPVGDPFDPYKSSYYLSGQRDLQNQLNSSLDPLSSELAKLQFKGADGMTDYDRQEAQLKLNTTQLARQMADEMAKRGLLRSGARDRATTDQTTTFNNSEMSLYNTLGLGRQQQIGIDQQRARDEYNQSLAGLKDQTTAYYLDNPIGG